MVLHFLQKGMASLLNIWLYHGNLQWFFTALYPLTKVMQEISARHLSMRKDFAYS